MKAKGKLEANFPEYEVTKQETSCDDFIMEKQGSLYKQLAMSMYKKEQFKNLTSCIMKDVRAENWVDDFMLSFIYAASETMSESQKQKKVTELTDKVMKTVFNAIDYCQYVKEFGELYDSLVNKSKNANKTEEQLRGFYCGRKYIVEHNLVDTTIHKIEFNPTNINVDGIDCNAMVQGKLKSLENEFIAMLSGDEIKLDSFKAKCALKKFRDGKFGDKFLTLLVVGDFDLTDVQRSKERNKFVYFHADVLGSLDVCDH